MANPFVKGWKYLMALFGSKIDEHADPKVQIQQAIEDAQRQHQALVQQAAAVIGNQRQLEMKLSRQLTEVENLQANARQALTLADKARAEGDSAKATDYEQTAQTFATQLVAAESSMEDLKSLHDQALGAAAQARKAVENNAMLLQQKLAERTKLLSQLEQAKMQETVARSLESMSQLAAPGTTPVAGRGPRQDRAAVRHRARPGRPGRGLGRGPPPRGAEGHPRHGRLDPPGGDPRQHGQARDRLGPAGVSRRAHRPVDEPANGRPAPIATCRARRTSVATGRGC